MVSILFIIGPDRLYPCRSFPDSHYHLVLGSLPVSAVIEPTLLPQFLVRDGECFSSCLASPCFRAATTAPPEWIRVLPSFSCIHAAFTRRLLVRPPNFQVSRSPVCSLTLRPGNSLTTARAALSLDSRGSVSLPSANQATGLWLLTRQVCLLLNMPAFAGHTTVP